MGLAAITPLCRGVKGASRWSDGSQGTVERSRGGDEPPATVLPIAAPTTPAGLLWGGRSFLTLWAGQTVSLVGSEVTLLALPLTAILYLGAGPAETGLLRALGLA